MTKEPAATTWVDDLAPLNTQDAGDMTRLGKQQQLRRAFSFWNMLGFAFILVATWEGIMTTFVDGLENGGPAGLLFGFFLVWLGYGAAVASIAEMMSAWPTSSGQYHWTYILAPPRWAPFLSYITGWQSVVAWQASVPSSLYFAATMLQGIIIENNPDYASTLWQGTLIMWALLLLGIIGNTIFMRAMPKLEYLALFIHIVGFIITLTIITVMTPSVSSTHDALGTWINAGGFPTQGVSTLVGVQGIIFAQLGADGAVHMAEEIQNASTVVPWCMVLSVNINALLAFGLLIAVLFCGGDLNTALETPTGFPMIAIYTYASRSVAGGTGLSLIIWLAFLILIVSVVATTSRQLWSYARDDGIPGARWLKRVDPAAKIPLRALLVTSIVTILLSLVNIGSAVAFDALVSLTIVSFLSSYIAPISLILYRRIREKRGGPAVPWGPWRLGRAGIALNIIGLTWSVFMVFWSFWPTVVNPTPAEMNWSCLIWAAETVFAVAFWFADGRRRYKGPVRDAAGGEIDATLEQAGPDSEQQT